MRGNLISECKRNTNKRSIPACAGEPERNSGSFLRMKVYPRVCGGTPGRRRIQPLFRGLSPRVRGNLPRCWTLGCRMRSIPACAGEPERNSGSFLRMKVYPRVCGGTPGRRRIQPLFRGLSPRVRGNQDRLGANRKRRWSIPACAGEPSGKRGGVTLTKVYPRVCGGTDIPVAVPPSSSGLSPRVRGNQKTQV